MVCPWCLLFLNINLHFTIVDRLLKVFSVCCFLPFQIISTYAIGCFFNEDMLNSDHVIRDVNTITPSRTAVGWVGSVFPSVLFCTSFCHIGPDRPGYEVPVHPPTQGGEIRSVLVDSKHRELESKFKFEKVWQCIREMAGEVLCGGDDWVRESARHLGNQSKWPGISLMDRDRFYFFWK